MCRLSFRCDPLSADRELTVLSRAWCHLCHDLLDALKPLQDELGFRVKVLDVDADDLLEARWSEWVPVVLDGDTEICHH
jgi:glutaredoxin